MKTNTPTPQKKEDGILDQTLFSTELYQARNALCKYIQYRGLALKDIKIDVDTIKGVIIFMGMEVMKWRQVDPKQVKFNQKAPTAIFYALQNFLEKPDEAQETVDETPRIDQSSFYPGQLQKLDDLNALL